MIKVSVLYPLTPKSRFDMSYYLDRHIPLVKERLGAALERTEVDRGIGGASPDSPPAFAAIAHLYFDSVEAYSEAFRGAADAILADIPNYTDIEPLIQISEVRTD